MTKLELLKAFFSSIGFNWTETIYSPDKMENIQIENFEQILSLKQSVNEYNFTRGGIPYSKGFWISDKKFEAYDMVTPVDDHSYYERGTDYSEKWQEFSQNNREAETSPVNKKDNQKNRNL